MHVVIGSTSTLRRGLAIAQDFADRRGAFGERIREHTLHCATLALLQVTLRGLLQLTVELIRLQGLHEGTTRSSRTGSRTRTCAGP